MIRIFWVGPVLAIVVGALGGCAAVQREPNEPAPSQAPSLPAGSEAKRITKQRVEEDIAAVKTLVVVACSARLNIPSVDRPEDMAAVKECTDGQLKTIASETLARIEAKELPDREAGQFMLNQAAAFLQANSEYARSRDPAELIQIALEGSKRLLLSKPE